MSEGDVTYVPTERVIFSGRVQGVGFRFTTRGIAKRFAVLGYVRNLPDGTVELVVQGAENEINGLLEKVSGHFRENLTKVERSRCEPEERFSCFEIRH